MYYIFSILADYSGMKEFYIILKSTFKVVGKVSSVIWLEYEQFLDS